MSGFEPSNNFREQQTPELEPARYLTYLYFDPLQSDVEDDH